MSTSCCQIQECIVILNIFITQQVFLHPSILGLLYGVAIGDAMALNTEGLTVDECNFFYDLENFSLENRISDYLRTHFPPHDWSSNTDVMVSLAGSRVVVVVVVVPFFCPYPNS